MHGASAGQPKPAGRVVLWVGQCVGKPRPRKSHDFKYITIKKAHDDVQGRKCHRRSCMECMMASLDAAAVPTKQRPVAMWAAHCHTTRRLCSRVHKFGAASQACRFTSPRQPRGGSFKKPPTNQRGIFYRKTTNQPRGASFEEKPQTNQGGHRLKKKNQPRGASFPKNTNRMDLRTPTKPTTNSRQSFSEAA